MACVGVGSYGTHKAVEEQLLLRPHLGDGVLYALGVIHRLFQREAVAAVAEHVAGDVVQHLAWQWRWQGMLVRVCVCVQGQLALWWQGMPACVRACNSACVRAGAAGVAVSKHACIHACVHVCVCAGAVGWREGGKSCMRAGAIGGAEAWHACMHACVRAGAAGGRGWTDRCVALCQASPTL